MSYFYNRTYQHQNVVVNSTKAVRPSSWKLSVTWIDQSKFYKPNKGRHQLIGENVANPVRSPATAYKKRIPISICPQCSALFVIDVRQRLIGRLKENPQALEDYTRV